MVAPPTSEQRFGPKPTGLVRGSKSGRPASEKPNNWNAVPAEPVVTVPTAGEQYHYPSPNRPSPYIAPVPTTYTTSSVTQRALDLQYYAPSIYENHPGAALAILSDPSVTYEEMAMIAALERGAALRANFENMPERQQFEEYGRLTPAQQQAMHELGYRVPDPVLRSVDPDDGGLWGRVKGAAQDTAGMLPGGDALYGLSEAAWSGADSLLDAGQNLAGEAYDVSGADTMAAGIPGLPYAGDALGNMAGWAGTAGSAVGGVAWKALVEPSEMVNRGLRSYRLTQNQDGFGATLGLGWLRNWEKAGARGDDVFDQGYLDEGRARFIAEGGTDELYDLAIEMQSLPPESQAEWMAETLADAMEQDPLQYERTYALLMSPSFAKASALVDGAHISVGRMITQDYGLADAGDKYFNQISGTIDAVSRVSTDPWILAGGASKALKAGSYTISAARKGKAVDAGAVSARIDEVFRHKNVIRNYEGTDGRNGLIGIVNTLRSSDEPAKIAEAQKALRAYGGLNEVNTAMIAAPKGVRFERATDVAEFFKGEVGATALMRGNAAFRGIRIQKKNSLEHWWAKHRPGSVVDWMDARAGLSAEKVGLTRAQMGLSDEVTEVGDDLVRGMPATAEDATAAMKATGQVIQAAAKRSRWFKTSNLVTRFTTYVPQTRNGKILLTDAGSVKQVQAMARTFGPRGWADNMATVYATSNEAGRRMIWKGLMETLGEASGITMTEQGAKWWSRYTSAMTGIAYSSVKGLDDAGDGVKHALLASDMRPYVAMPEFSVMHAQAARMGVLNKVGHAATRSEFDWYIQRIFKPGVLLRTALIMRNAGEEIARHSMHYGVSNYITGRFMRTHLRGGKLRASTGKRGLRDPRYDDEWRIWRLLTKPAFATYERTLNGLSRGKMLGSRSRYTGKSARDWFVGATLDKMRRAVLTKTYGKRTVKALEDAWDNDPMLRRLHDEQVMESTAAFYGIDQSPLLRAGIKEGTDDFFNALHRGKGVQRQFTLSWRESGDHALRNVEGREGAVRWAIRTDKLAHDDFAQAAVLHLDDPVKAKAAVIEALQNSPDAKRSALMAKAGIDDFAERIIEEARYTFTSKDGRFLDELWNTVAPIGDDGARHIDDAALSGEKFDALVPLSDRPASILGREVVHVERDKPSLIARIIDEGFEYVGESTHYISRSPIFFSHLADEFAKMRPQYIQLINEGAVPTKVLASARKEFARGLVREGDEPVTFVHHAATKMDELDPAALANMDSPYGMGVPLVRQGDGIASAPVNPRNLDPNLNVLESSALWNDGAAGSRQVVEYVSTAKLLTMRGNGINAGRVDDLARSLADDGFREPLMVRFDPKTGQAYLAEGNHRLLAASQLGREHVPVVVVRGGVESTADDIAEATRQAGGVFQPKPMPGAKAPATNVGGESVWPDMFAPSSVFGPDDMWRAGAPAVEHTVWTTARRSLDLSDAVKPDDFAKHVRMFAKRGGFGDDWAEAQIRAAAFKERFVLDDVYKAASAQSVRKANEGLQGMLKAGRFKAFDRVDDAGRKVKHVLDGDAIKANRYPETVTAGKRNKFAENRANKMAYQNAVEKTLTYVDNPLVRSQFAVINRNLFPFWRAQQEFYVRWARTFKHAPEAFRKAQLTIMGLEHSGFVQRDDNNQLFFVYPGFEAATEAFRGFGRLVGLDFGHVPVNNSYRGQLRFLNMGVDPRNIQPNVSPLLGLPVAIIRQLYPETAAVENFVVGEQGAGRNPWLNLLPTPLRRLVDAGMFKDGDEWSSQMASSSMSAIAYMEATGQTPPDDASAAEVDQYIQRVRQWTIATLTLRAVTGMFAPTPLEQMDRSAPLPDHLQVPGMQTVDQQFQYMLAEMDYEKAMQAWMISNPDQIPFTVGTTESESGVWWNSTKKVGEFYAANRELFEEFPRVAPFLFPQDPTGEWDPTVYNIEMANGLRTQKDVKEFYRDLKINGELGVYYDSRDALEAAVEEQKANGNYEMAAFYEQDFAEWQETWLKQHPLVKEYRDLGQARAGERVQILDETRAFLEKAPESETTRVMGGMIESWDALDDYLRSNSGNTAAAVAARNQARESWREHMESLAEKDAGGLMFYNRVFRYMEG